VCVCVFTVSCRFYAAEVVAALEYVHMMDIVYRDLKPENVLVRADGHIMLTDFDLSLKCDPTAPTPAHVISDSAALAGGGHSSTASCAISSCIVPAVSCFQLFPGRSRRRRRWRGSKKASYSTGGSGFPSGGDLEFVAEPVELRSMSFVGTHEYLAPEIVSGEGHGSSVDWWTLGVFVFELLYGATPFKGYDNETTLANIVARALEFPKEPPVSPGARDLVAALLAKDPVRRLGATVGAAAIKRHPFFNGVNWALLRCAAPPYVPPPFTLAAASVKAAAGGNNAAASDDVSEDDDDDSCPGTPVEYY
jgi:protein-serine/threonine kinase